MSPSRAGSSGGEPRVAIGPIAGPRLPRGGWRELTEDEVERLRGQSDRPARAVKPKAPRPRRTAPAGRSAPGRSHDPGRGKGRKRGPGRGRRG